MPGLLGSNIYMKQTRASGILLHPTSFPGPHGIGDLGDAAYRFIDFMKDAGMSLWQVLPLGPTGYGDSPYASFSSFAGNPLLVNLDKLVGTGDLDVADLAMVPDFPVEHVDYGWVQYWKVPLLKKAAKRFLVAAAKERKEDYQSFIKKHADWLDDYALFMAVKEHFDEKARKEGAGGAMWNNYWDTGIALKEPVAVRSWTQKLAEELEIKKVLQYFFFSQWHALRDYANNWGIEIIGDIPIFVAPDSVDVWANRDLFYLDETGILTVVAGVPPDYFSATGQLWGNPLYNWEVMEENRFAWWIKRIKATLELVDIIRIDHFRGFAAYWEVPAGEPTAVKGKWVHAPGMKLFETIKKELGELPILAEDLGEITNDVHEMRDRFGFPGMKILQFAFDEGESGGINSDNIFLPHNHNRNSVVYSGTHDNDTTRGWYRSRNEREKDMIRRYLARDDNDIVWDFIRMAFASHSIFAIIPLQDILDLESFARMNTPSTLGGNWCWRYLPGLPNEWHSSRLKEMNMLYGRDQK